MVTSIATTGWSPTKPKVAIVSGGMDSVTMAYALRRYIAGDGLLKLVSFDYGQRHKREIEYARLAAKELQAEHVLVDVTTLNPLLQGSALVSPSIDVPHGHYAAENMKLTVVPNRNAIMLTIAFGYAQSIGADFVGTAVHSGDHVIYPDCRPEFTLAFDYMQQLAQAGFGKIRLWTPFIHISKADIVSYGENLGVPWQNTWSCYEGGHEHCGQCGTCVERMEAFRIAGIPDPTVYAEEGKVSYLKLVDSGIVK